MSGVLLANSVIIALSTAVLATGVGAVAARVLLEVGRRLRIVMVALGILALAMPPFLATNSWIRWVGLAGRLAESSGTKMGPLGPWCW